MRTSLLAFLAMAITTSHLFAEVAPTEFKELVNSSDAIVVAKVESVTKQYAKATVVENWKGKITNTVEFLASPTWTCDISEAKAGETLLLFLAKSDMSRSYVIAHSGRGRMPLRTVAGKTYATFWLDVILPEGTPTIDGSDPQWEFIRSVEVAILHDLVKKVGQKKD